jgi:hypothetical protein
MFINRRVITKRSFKQGDLEEGVRIMAQGKASSMTAGAGSGVGRMQKAGMKTSGTISGGSTHGQYPINTGPASGDSKAGYGGGKSRGGGAATRGTRFRGVYATAEVDFDALQRQRIR